VTPSSGDPEVTPSSGDPEVTSQPGDPEVTSSFGDPEVTSFQILFRQAIPSLAPLTSNLRR
jgi:hypothetical protein